MHSGQLLIVLAVASVTLGAVTVLRRAGIPPQSCWWWPA